LLKAYVTEVEERWPEKPSTAYLSKESSRLRAQYRFAIRWKCGIREGEVYEEDESATWIHGHGPEARKALLAARAMR